jgi:putative PIN family toxin of toxin-antitoxin system
LTLPKAVLDTNVLISAIVFGGTPRKILNEVINGRLKVAISREILHEIQGILLGKKFKYPEEVVNAITNQLTILCEIVLPAQRVEIVRSDPADNRIIECALEAKAQYIITGDSHLIELKEVHGISIVTPGEFLAINLAYQ